MTYVQRVQRGERTHLYFQSPTGFRIKLPSPASADFPAIYGAAMTRAVSEMGARDQVRTSYREAAAAGALWPFFRRMASRAKFNAKRLSVPFNLAAADLVQLSDEQGHCCALTGLPFSTDASTRSGMSPFAPSPDRLTTGLGYVLGNVRLVCVMANFARLDFSDDEFYRMCYAAVEHHRQGRLLKTDDPLVKAENYSRKIKMLKAKA
jgi:hypothetical protein